MSHPRRISSHRPAVLGVAAAAAVTAALALAGPVSAAPVVRQAAGPNGAAIEPAVDLYRQDLGEPSNGGEPGPFEGGRREINWDATPAEVSEPNLLPPDFFNGDADPKARGAVFATPGSGVMVSGGGEGAEPIRFSSLNPSYATAFGSFSPEKLFAPIGSTETNVNLYVPGQTTTPGASTGFGVVFTDVDRTGSARLELFDPYGEPLGSWDASPSEGDGGYSFLGVSFNAGETVGTAKITSGDAALTDGGDSPDDITQGGADDVVALDDFLYGEPAEAPLEFGKAKRNKDRGTAKLTALVPGDGTVALRKSKTVKGAEVESEERGSVKLKVVPKGKAKRKLNRRGKARVRLSVEWTPTDGETSTEKKKLKLKKR